jgi:hypothetical protein
MDKDLLMKTLTELFLEERIKIELGEFHNWNENGVKLTVKL